MVKYRSSLCRRTGRLLTGMPCVEQAIERILTTHLTEMVMQLDFGSSVIGLIGRNIHADLIAQLYRETVVAIHKWEPEFRVSKLQLVTIERTGTLGFSLAGTYYPEGRNGNFSTSETATLTVGIAG